MNLKSLMRAVGQRLVDASGNKLTDAEVTEERAGPTTVGVRDPISGHPADGLTPARLAAIHREAAMGEPLRYLELAEDIVERDLHYAGVMATRKRSVSQLPITVTAASDATEHKKHAEYVQSWINDGVLQASLFDMLDAIGKGFSVLEADWQSHMGHTCPREFIYRPQRWFTFDRTDGETVLLREATGDQPLAPHKFVVHRHKSKSGLTIRSGIARVASWAWMYKAFTAKDWAIFVQNYGAPIRIGRYGRNASNDEKDILWRAVSQIAGDCAAIIPQDMSIEFQEVAAKSASTDLFERRADWMDRQISKAVLGQTTTTDAVSGGHAVSREHRLVQEDIERSDAIASSTTTNRQIVPNLVAFEFGPQDHYPTVSIGRPDEVPLKEFSEAFDKLGKHGLTAPITWVWSRLGIPAPKAGEEVIGGRQPVPAKTSEPQTNSVSDLLRTRHAREQTDTIVEQLTQRIENDAAGAMAGLTDEIRAILENATDLADAAEKLAQLDLKPEALAVAMARGMALSHLAGQAALVDELTGRK